TMIGTDGPDVLDGAGGGADHLVGGAGDDLLLGEDRNDGGDAVDIEGGEGDDGITAFAGTVLAGPGDDDVTVDGPTTVRLGPGADLVFLALLSIGPEVDGASLVTGGAGDDDISVLAPLATTPMEITGGAGRDRLQYHPSGPRVVYRLDVTRGTV